MTKTPTSVLPGLLALLTLPLALASCSSGPEMPEQFMNRMGYKPQARTRMTGRSFWNDPGGEGKKHVVVDLSDQLATFYRDDTVIGQAAISSGKDGRRTRPGNFAIMEKIQDKESTSYGWIEDRDGNVVNNDATPGTPRPPGTKYVPAPMPYWMRLTSDGVGMHQGFLPGYPASHGCIRVDKAVIAQFFDAAYVGMPVKVVGKPPRLDETDVNMPTGFSR